MLNQTTIPRHELRQEQRQMLVPQQLQSLEILMTPLLELEQKISQELEENPTLEMLENGAEDLVGDPLSNVQDDNGTDIWEGAEEGADIAGDTLKDLLTLENLWQDRMPAMSPASAKGNDADDDEKRQHALNSLTNPDTLEGELLIQLRELVDLDEETRVLCEEVIGSIDETGYMRTHLADIATACSVDLPEAEDALQIVQGFDPPGVGARDLRECLMLQLEREGRQEELVYQVVRDHFEEIGRNKLKNVSRKLGISIESLRLEIEQIRQLAPYPGTQIAPLEHTDLIAPEVFIEKDERDEWSVRTNKDYTPRLRISPQYLKMLESEEVSKDAKSYIRNKLANSKQLMRALEQRESTLVRIARVLLDKQIAFFKYGKSALKPLTLKDVADVLDVHQTTVSRAIAGKYLQCPQGVFAFKFFFTAGYENTDGEQASSIAIKEKLGELIGNEDPAKPLSDQRLVNELKDQGFKVARRTVAKYREELGVLSSSLRRRHN